MRLWFSVLTLMSFLPQQFAGCATNCPAEAVSLAAGATESVCSHGHHSQEHKLPNPDHDPAHHLCVSTHLFYLARCASGALPESILNQAVLADGREWLVSAHSNVMTEAAPVLSTAASRRRALMGVWII